MLHSELDTVQTACRSLQGQGSNEHHEHCVTLGIHFVPRATTLHCIAYLVVVWAL